MIVTKTGNEWRALKFELADSEDPIPRYMQYDCKSTVSDLDDVVEPEHNDRVYIADTGYTYHYTLNETWQIVPVSRERTAMSEL